MDELKNEIAGLEAQETQIQDRLNGAQDSDESVRITNELNIVRNRLSEKREELRQLQEKEQARAEEIEDRVNAEPVPFTALGIDLSGMPPKLIKLIEDIYRATRRDSLNEHAIELEQMEAEHANRMQAKIAEYSELAGHITELDNSSRELTAAVDQLEHALAQEILEKEDAINKRDAAVREKEEIEIQLVTQIKSRDDEINTLRNKVEEYEKAAEYKARQDQPISMTQEETNYLQASVDAVKKLFTHYEDWGTRIQAFKPEGGFELVKRSEFEEEWTPTPPELSLELPSFREEDTIPDAPDYQLPDPETIAVVTDESGPMLRAQIESEDTFQDDVLAGPSDTGEAEEESGEVTRAEFEARMTNVEKGMEQLMRKVFGEVAA